MPKFHYYRGVQNSQKPDSWVITAEAVKNLNPTKPPVFIFPGNTGHHGSGSSLFSYKGGSGLAEVSGEYSGDGYPTLSLPTTGMQQVKAGQIPKLAKDAVADLWRALGAGYDLVLPVRNHGVHKKTNEKYFNKALKGTNNLEPSFWGAAEKDPNIHLANYYKEQIDLLHDFLALNKNAQDTFLQSHAHLKAAYDEGLANATTPTDWYKKQPPKQQNKQTIKTKPKTAAPVALRKTFTQDTVVSGKPIAPLNLSSPIYIYGDIAAGEPSDESQLGYSRAKCSLDDSQKQELVSTSGLKIQASGGQSYRLSCDQGQATATMSYFDAHRGGDYAPMYKEKISISYINMIDNIYAKGGGVDFNTRDPFAAAIAYQYFEYLSKERNIDTSSFTITLKNKPYSYNWNNQARATFDKILPALEKADSTEWDKDIQKGPQEKMRYYQDYIESIRNEGHSPESNKDNLPEPPRA